MLARALLLLLLLVLVWQSKYVLGAQNQTPQDVTRSSFPKGFVFGAASAAYQYEGAASEGGRGPSIWDTFAHNSGKIKGNATGDVAVDQYHRFQEDMWLLKDLNMDAYRFSISWSRIFPSGVGEVNWKGVQYYDRLIDFLTKHDIEPWVTLYHWDMPQALEDSIGGWLSLDIVNMFEQYARFCFQRWGTKVKHWITLNEIHSFAVDGYRIGSKAPGRCSPPLGECPTGNSTTEPYIVGHHALLSHAQVVNLYKKEFQEEQKGVIGITLDSLWFEPLDSNSSLDKQASKTALEGFLGWFMDPIFFGDYPASMKITLGSVLPNFTLEQKSLLKGSQDFIGINQYTSNYATYNTTNGELIRTPYKDGVPIGDQVEQKKTKMDA
uniref:Beta-glucosidase n=1 Tax=Physcomitrium patens TaxID=3218 RepID=A0A7I4CGE9_PHYPA